MADVDGSSLFGEALLWTKFNGIIERFSRTYITMGQYIHILQCKTVEPCIYTFEDGNSTVIVRSCNRLSPAEVYECGSKQE